MACPNSLTGMNAAVRAVTRMGIYVGAKVFLIYEVRSCAGGGHVGVACGEVTCVCACREHIVLWHGIVCCVLVTLEVSGGWAWTNRMDVVWGRG